MANIAAPFAAQLRAQGLPTECSLLDLQLTNGTRLFYSDCPLSAVTPLAAFDAAPAPIISGGRVIHPPSDALVPVNYLPYLIDPPEFTNTGTLVTQTATVTLQNVSGDTVQRVFSAMFSKWDIWGALAIYRLWQPAAQNALLTQLCYVDDCEIDGDQMELTLSTWLNFSRITAPDCEINNSCQNVFASEQCGSTSSTNCLNSYGNCSQLNRFKGLIIQWDSSAYSVAANSSVAQPVPPTFFNPRLPG